VEVFNRVLSRVFFFATAIGFALGKVNAQNDLRINDICRLKGQEENTLQGLGLVVGLKGTGDGGDIKPMIRALSRVMQNMGGQVAADIQGRLLEKEMANAKNVALVFVEVTVPPSGAQPGDKLSCKVSAIGAKSLEGGNLMLTHLLGPRADRPVVYGLASGPIVIDSPKVPTSGKVVDGCKMELAVVNEFVAGDKISLIVDPDHRSIATSQNIEDSINEYQSSVDSTSSTKSNSNNYGRVEKNKTARAIDQTTIEVTIPSIYKQYPLQFVSLVLDLKLLNLQNKKRVYIDEREGVLIIGEEVSIAPVAISHKNLTISARGPVKPKGSFVSMSSKDGDAERPTLKNLTDALNVLAVPTADQISIIKALKKDGLLFGELVIE
jgi:flagellar P-ring protein FlgI